MKKRIWSLLLAAVMLLGLGVTALAEGTAEPEAESAGAEVSEQLEKSETPEPSGETEVSEETEPSEVTEQAEDEEKTEDEAQTEGEEQTLETELSDAAPIANTVTITYDVPDGAIKGERPAEVSEGETVYITALKPYKLYLDEDRSDMHSFELRLDREEKDAYVYALTMWEPSTGGVTLCAEKVPVLKVEGGNADALVSSVTIEDGWTEYGTTDGQPIINGTVILKNGYKITSTKGGTAYYDEPYADISGTIYNFYSIRIDEGAETVTITIGTAGKSNVVNVRLANGYSLIADRGYIGVTPNSIPFDDQYHKGPTDMGAYPCGESFREELGCNYDIAFDVQASMDDGCFYLTFQGGTVVEEPMISGHPGVSTHSGQGVAVLVNEGAKELVVTVNKRADHDLEEKIIKAPTCVAEGEGEYTCSLCGKGEKRTIPATGEHTWNEGDVTKEPTFLAEGEKTVTCTVCGEEQTKSIPRLEATVGAEGTDSAADADAAEKALTGAADDILDAVAKGEDPAGVAPETAEKIRAALGNGKKEDDVTITAELVVEPGTDDGTIANAVDGEVAAYVDISIQLKVNGEAAGTITETAQEIDFAVPVPQGMTAPILYVVRDHEGDVQEIDATVSDGKVCFASKLFSTFAIVGTDEVAHATVEEIPDQTWSGKPAEPKVTVTVQGPNGPETLEAGTDYTVTYKDNGGPGNAKAVITGAGRFKGTVEAPFTIKAPAASKPAAVPTSPETGDEAPLALWAGALALCLGGLVLALAARKKRGVR